MSIVLDRPPAEEAERIEEPPPTEPRRRRQWWKWRFPWVKTAVGAPADDEPLLIVNATDVAWALSLGYHDLGVLPPRDEYSFEVVKAGLLSARQPNAAPGTPYLTLPLAPRVSVVEIGARVLQGETLYGLSVMRGRDTHPSTAKELYPHPL